MRNSQSQRKPLSQLEHLVMDYLWTNGPATSEQIRQGLESTHAMKDATARTILRRLEEKGYVQHKEEGRTYIYSGAEQAENVAMRAIRQIIDRFWGGSAEALVAGMVEQEVIDPHELRELAKKLEKKGK
jgi:predicted transcriptional regulator